MVTAPEIADSQGEDGKGSSVSKLPEPGMKYKLIINLISGTDLAVRDRCGELAFSRITSTYQYQGHTYCK